ncbi:MAG: DsrE/DsrF/DrsH-like family protein [Chloroflexia bacterium]|nr:DsrE/DsrF/DrsH-like family protein [Chloroflexia bacterium]
MNMDKNKGDEKRVTLVLFSGEMDKALAAFTIANTAAAMGMQVTIFFTFWGLNVIKRPGRGRGGRGWMRRMLNWMNRGNARSLPLSKFNFAGLGPWMMKRLMREQRMLPLEEMIAQAHKLGVNMLACSTSIGLMGLSKDDFIPEVETIAGAATFLNEARQAEVNLFI